MPITPAIEALILAHGNAMQIAAQSEQEGVNRCASPGCSRSRRADQPEEVLGCTNE
jgi:type IV pilus assembly protein PilB